MSWEREERDRGITRLKQIQEGLKNGTLSDPYYYNLITDKCIFPSPKAIGMNADIHGFRLEGQQFPDKRRPIYLHTSLLHSEVNEIFEGIRNGIPINGKGGLREEAADVYIRLADLCDEYEINLVKAVNEKHLKNIQREWMHGKKF